MTTLETDAGPVSITDVSSAVRQFLTAALPDVCRVDVMKIRRAEGGEAAWDAEADVWQPNPTLQTLGIETQRPVLDHQRCCLRLDALLNVLDYELTKADR
jgi:hypothetical protein